MSKPPTNQTKRVRCAIYTRKSTEEGLAQEFNTLDAQRESAEAYIAAQKHEGWVCLPERYDDGGFTGGNLDRPAVQRLMKDIAAGKIDCVIVYKVDRLSRSLLDFSKIMETFDRHNVSFVSVTQQFNTTHSMGRLTLNILLSFAQFEREIISERTRDKVAATRRKGKWSGGHPVLGYDIVRNASGPKLVVNDVEAERVRAIFDLYIQHETLPPVVEELTKRGWTAKMWEKRDGHTGGGRVFDKNAVYHLLTNVMYTGKVKYLDEIHAGQHDAIVTSDTWRRVQALLQRNHRTGGKMVRNKHGALLKGLLSCTACDCAMGHTYSSKGSKRYRYYVCCKAQKRGWDACPTKSVPAGEMEKFVINQIKSIGHDPSVLSATLNQMREQDRLHLADGFNEESGLQRELALLSSDLPKLAIAGNSAIDQLASTQERIREIEQRLTLIREDATVRTNGMVADGDVRAALSVFNPAWETLSPREQARIIRLLVEHVGYDGRTETITITFRPNGIKTLATELKGA